MADLPPSPDERHNAGAEPDRGSITGTPRWVKVFGIIFVVVVVVFVVLLLTAGHGPSRHTGGDDGQTPSMQPP